MKAFMHLGVAMLLIAGSGVCVWQMASGSEDLQSDKSDTYHRRLVVQSFETVNAEPNPTYVLLLTLLRVVIVLYIAPVILFYGPALRNFVIVFQAATAAGLWTWWDALTNVAYVGDIPPLFEGLVKVLFGGGTAGYTMMSWDDVDLLVKGALFIYQLFNTVLGLLEEALHQWAGCTGFHMPALALRGQSYDTWIGCSDRDAYYTGIWILKIIEWSGIIAGGLLAKKLHTYVMLVSASMYGAELLVVSIMQALYDLISVFSSKEAAESAQVTLLVNKAIFVYVFFAIGLIFQHGLKEWLAALSKKTVLTVSSSQGDDEEYAASVKDQVKELEDQMEELAKARWGFSMFTNKYSQAFAYPALRFSVLLSKSYNKVDSLVKAVQGGNGEIARFEEANADRLNHTEPTKENKEGSDAAQTIEVKVSDEVVPDGLQGN